MGPARMEPLRMPSSKAPAAPRAKGAKRAASGTALATLRNLGTQSQAMLEAAGIHGPHDLQRLGAIGAYQRVREVTPRASLNLLYALVGALEDLDWREVRRTRKLALLMALEATPPAQARAGTHGAVADSLLALRNIGPAMRRDLALLGVHSATQLARQAPDRLYLRLQRLTGRRHDLCVWDTFAAAIHQARTGEALPWWHFTAERKERMAQGRFVAWAAAAGRKSSAR